MLSCAYSHHFSSALWWHQINGEHEKMKLVDIRSLCAMESNLKINVNGSMKQKLTSWKHNSHIVHSVKILLTVPSAAFALSIFCLLLHRWLSQALGGRLLGTVRPPVGQHLSTYLYKQAFLFQFSDRLLTYLINLPPFVDLKKMQTVSLKSSPKKITSLTRDMGSHDLPHASLRLRFILILSQIGGIG